MADKRTPVQQERAERLAAALRDNLKKRKARARDVGGENASDGAPETP